jgi:hypothetical protein
MPPLLFLMHNVIQPCRTVTHYYPRRYPCPIQQTKPFFQASPDGHACSACTGTVRHTISYLSSSFDIKTLQPLQLPSPQNPNILKNNTRHCCPTFAVGTGIKDTISVRARVPVVPFLRRARRYPDTPQSNDGNRLHHECAQPPRERLWLARSANSSLWFCPRWKRRCRICPQMVAAPSRATAAAKIC